MCGINGLIKYTDKDSLINNIKKMNNMINYRGPDNSDFYYNKNLCFGHNRLSIIDLTKNSNQPFFYDNLVIVYNGEIYNYKRLRNELKNLGYKFKTSSDTEVVIKSFHRWNTKSFNKFEGMFSLSIYDIKNEFLYLARDFFGEKPLYYNYIEGKQVIFSSEISPVKYILKKKSDTQINKKIIPHYLKYLYLPSDKSPYKSISSLEKGKYLKINLKTLLLERHDSYTEKNENKNYSLSTLKENLISSIKDQLVADVEVGLWLSGGVDSSLIAAIARKEFNIKLNTFTVKFSNDFSYNNEYINASRVAKQFNHSINFLDVNYDINDELINNVISKQENLIANPSAILHELLCEKTSFFNAKVILNGLGGDEFFGGYNRYKAYSYYNAVKKIKKNYLIENLIKFVLSKINKSRNNPIGNINRSILKLLASFDYNKSNFYDNIISYKKDDSIRKFSKIINDNDPYNDLMKFDIDNYMINDLLYLSDKFSMSYSFEIRSPFLNKNLYTNCFLNSSKNRMGDPGEKQSLYDWLYYYSDGNYKKQRKKGFTVSIEPYLKAYGKKQLLYLFKKAEIFDLIEDVYITGILDGFYNGEENVNQLYSLFYLSKWRIINNE